MIETSNDVRTTAVFGLPPPELIEITPGAVQFSPLLPGSMSLDGIEPGSLGAMTMYAVPGTLERRYDLALMLQALAPGAPFTVLAPKGMGGARLKSELGAFGCVVDDVAKRHHRICSGTRPAILDDIDTAIAEGAPRRLHDLGLWSQPGIFSWNRLDPGTELLMDSLPALSGRGADLGCGIGTLAHSVLSSSAVTRLHLIDIDRRAIDAARRNVDDTRASFLWTDIRRELTVDGLDFAVMNPPFHEAGTEDKHLGALFIERAAGALRPGGDLWLVANKHLPYEKVLTSTFRTVTQMIETRGFKVVTARK